MISSSFIYSEFISRNYLYIKEELQHEIRNKKIAFFGTGLSSNIAEACTRLGFNRMYLNDGDKIELSNLNRQSFNFGDIGSFKAEVLKNRILNINPSCEISTNTNYINKIEEIEKEIETSDIIVNTVDCNQIYFDIIEYARKHDKLIICPFNPGFAGLVICFTKYSAASHEVFDIENKELNDVEIARQLFMKYPEMKTLEQAGTTLDQFLANSSNSYFPQIIIGALLTTALVLSIMVKFLKKEPFLLAPAISHIDSWVF